MDLTSTDRSNVSAAFRCFPEQPKRFAFACPACDILLDEGIVYSTCPTCDRRVDWIDPRIPLWCCPTCDAIVNDRVAHTPYCHRCGRNMLRPPVAREIGEPSRWREKLLLIAGLIVFACCLIAPLVLAAMGPRARWFALAFIGPILLVGVMKGGLLVLDFFASVVALFFIMRDRTTRVLHGLEHATIAVLEERGLRVAYGLTTEGSFKLRFDRYQGRPGDERMVKEAFLDAAYRLLSGETQLAYHPRCGTSAVIALMSLGVTVVGVAVLGLYSSFAPAVLVGLIACLVATFALTTRRLGLAAQRHCTVSTDFRSAELLRVVRRADSRHVVYDVKVAVMRQ